ncbi:hypothetical protein H104_08176 [Trichophyton rubrum CBS 289.86]|nr:hypothetical protein H104_08176 [Trichophyton rubrum CBS 289.86]
MEKVVFSGVVFQVSWICCLEGSCLKGKFLQDISLASRDRGRAESDRLSTANTHGEIPQMGSWEETMQMTSMTLRQLGVMVKGEPTWKMSCCFWLLNIPDAGLWEARESEFGVLLAAQEDIELSLDLDTGLGA